MGTAFFITLMIMLSLVIMGRHRRQDAWKVVMEGEYAAAEYGSAGIFSTTIVRFSDGRSCKLFARLEMPYPAGEKVCISENACGDLKIEKVAAPSEAATR